MKDIDRIAPTLRPGRTAVMHQRWAELGFLHWPVPVAALRPLIPKALTIDTHDGQAYVGLVPFTVTGARPMLVPPLPWVSRFIWRSLLMASPWLPDCPWLPEVIP